MYFRERASREVIDEVEAIKESSDEALVVLRALHAHYISLRSEVGFHDRAYMFFGAMGFAAANEIQFDEDRAIFREEEVKHAGQTEVPPT